MVFVSHLLFLMMHLSANRVNFRLASSSFTRPRGASSYCKPRGTTTEVTIPELGRVGVVVLG